MTEYVIATSWVYPEDCTENPTNLYIFGDNLARKGLGGGACIRVCPNSFGIATKRWPGRRESDYFEDTAETKQLIRTELINLSKAAKNYNKVVFPIDGIGNGLAEMPSRCPEAYKYMNALIADILNIPEYPVPK